MTAPLGAICGVSVFPFLISMAIAQTPEPCLWVSSEVQVVGARTTESLGHSSQIGFTYVVQALGLEIRHAGEVVGLLTTEGYAATGPGTEVWPHAELIKHLSQAGARTAGPWPTAAPDGCESVAAARPLSVLWFGKEDVPRVVDTLLARRNGDEVQLLSAEDGRLLGSTRELGKKHAGPDADAIQAALLALYSPPKQRQLD